MAWKVFPLLVVTSLLILNAVLFVYDMNSRKTEAPEISKISSGKDVGPHGMDFTPALRQALKNRKFIADGDQVWFVVAWEWHRL